MRIIQKLILVSMAGLLLTGCGSLLRFEKSERQDIPAPPRETLQLKKNKQKAIQFSQDILDRVYTYGVEKGNEVVGQARDLCGIVLATEGAPAKPVEVPARISLAEVKKTREEVARLSGRISQLQEEADELKEDLQYYSAAHVEKQDAFENYLQERRDQELGVQESYEVRSDWLAWFSGIFGTLGVVGPIAVIALIIFVPGSVGLMWTILRRARRGIGQVAAAAQELMEDDDLDRESKEKIRVKLHEKMDEKTKASFDKWGHKWEKKTASLGP